MDISIEQIKALRERSGISMTACKNALVEAGGDEEKAIEILRKKGAAKAAERAERTTPFGVVAVAKGNGKVAMVAVGCETDFVAKNSDFIKQAEAIALAFLANGEAYDSSKEFSDLNIQMGEKIELVDKVVVEAPMISTYIHSNNRIGVVVALSGGDDMVGQDIAMHVAAMKPKFVSPDEVAAELVAKEKEIWSEQLATEGKPADIIEKIMLGKEKKFREESALLTQPFVKNADQMVKDLLKAGESVVQFWRFEV